jgi:fluoride exporter
MLYSFVAIGVGAVLGAWLRWGLGITLNPLFPNLPLGTFAANLLGGYVIGLALEYFSHHSSLPPEARLFVVTGFLGALTTFSTFSAEAVNLLAQGKYGWSLVLIVAHVIGSIAMTILGMLTLRAFAS